MEQMDLLVDAQSEKILTVSDLNQQIRSQLEGEFPSIWVQGEISNFKPHSSGHWYFSLKDTQSQISAVMFRGLNSRVPFQPQSGQEVIVKGKITVYEPRGNYQIFCESMEPVGAGALQLAFDQLKKKLHAEGLFAPERKRPLPALPKHIALITSPTGAAVKDMLNVLERRFKGLHITLIPALVQGERAPSSLIDGLQKAQKLKNLDVIIIGRGGGSMEDLWAFNDEGLARSIVASKIPIISAVGHEIDFTIADFVADLRAPTPSAAAELVVKNATDLLDKIQHIKLRLWQSWQNQLRTKVQTALSLSQRLVDPQRRLQDLMLRCDELRSRLERVCLSQLKDRNYRLSVMNKALPSPMDIISNWRDQTSFHTHQMKAYILQLVKDKKAQVFKDMALLDSLSPLRVLDRGYSLVYADIKSKPQLIKSVGQLTMDTTVQIKLSDGSFHAKVIQISEHSDISNNTKNSGSASHRRS